MRTLLLKNLRPKITWQTPKHIRQKYVNKGWTVTNYVKIYIKPKKVSKKK